jgi:hypothetical protein
MSRYAELTTSLGDGLTRALERVEQVQIDLITGVNRTLGRYLPELPKPPYTDRLPSVRSVVDANYDLAERVLKAQRKYALGILEALSQAPQEAPKGRKTEA